MIINVYMNSEDSRRERLTYYFKEEGDSSIIAYATNTMDTEGIKLYFNEKTYFFSNRIISIEVDKIEKLPYPQVIKTKTTPGFEVLEDNMCIMQYYGQAATVQESGIVKNNISVGAYKYEDTYFTVYKVGISKDNAHFYCVYNAEMECICVVERKYGESPRAIIYIENDEDLLLSLLICTEETIDVSNLGKKEYQKDRSAGRYISRFEEEKAFLDRNFIKRIKIQSSLKSNGYLSESVFRYDEIVKEYSNECQLKLENSRKKSNIVWIFAVVFLIFFWIFKVISFGL